MQKWDPQNPQIDYFSTIYSLFMTSLQMFDMERGMACKDFYFPAISFGTHFSSKSCKHVTKRLWMVKKYSIWRFCGSHFCQKWPYMMGEVGQLHIYKCCNPKKPVASNEIKKSFQITRAIKKKLWETINIILMKVRKKNVTETGWN